MKKLTKKERNKIYRKVYDICLTDEWLKDEFICNQIQGISEISKLYIFDYLPEFDLFRPENHELNDPFIMSYYNEGKWVNSEEFQPIQATILAFCIQMSQ